MVKNAGNSQEEMSNLLQYIELNKNNRNITPIEDWPDIT